MSLKQYAVNAWAGVVEKCGLTLNYASKKLWKIKFCTAYRGNYGRLARETIPPVFNKHL